MLEAYKRAFDRAFTPQNVRSGWRRSGLWPLNRECGPVTHPDEKADLPRPLTPDTPPHQPPEIYVKTPKSAADIASAIREWNSETSPLSRRTRTLLNKAGSTISRLTAELARQREATRQQALELEKHQPDKRQNVETNQNNVFAGLTEVRSAQDKRNKRLRPLTENVQTEIDTFVEHGQTSSNKRQRV
ncbi:hypothetical protein RRF57_003261 [Xylaria bambusicola]